MNTTRVEDEIKKQGSKYGETFFGTTVVGIASVDDVNRYAPKGHRPDDMLKGAKSVVVVGIGLTSAGAWHAGQPRAQASVCYNRMAAPSVAQHIVRLIEENYGYYALSCPPGLANGRQPYVSLKLLAEMAGLGTRSMAGGILLNETHGLLYYGAALTTMPLAADGPLEKPVCPHPSCVKLWDLKRALPCLDACPTCLSGELEGDSIKWMEYNQSYCLPRAQTTGMGALQTLLLEAMDEPDAKKRKMMIWGNHFYRIANSIATSTEVVGQCFECIRKCPIVRTTNRRLK